MLQYLKNDTLWISYTSTTTFFQSHKTKLPSLFPELNIFHHPNVEAATNSAKIVTVLKVFVIMVFTGIKGEKGCSPTTTQSIAYYKMCFIARWRMATT